MSSHASATDLPLLMLSHCLPDPRGHAEAARAWQLLRLVACSHAVHLVCAVHGSIGLEHWRLLSARTASLQLVRVGPWRRAVGSGAVWVKAPGTSLAAALATASPQPATLSIP